MARYLIVGGSGFLGAHLHAALRATRNLCRILDPAPPVLPVQALSATPVPPERIDWIQGSATDLATVRNAVEGCDGIFHLAAGTPPVEPTAGLAGVAAIAGASGIPLVYASSAAVYGAAWEKLTAAARGGPLRFRIAETQPLTPLSPEARLLCDAERAVRIIQARQGVPMLGLRFFSVYGPHPTPNAANAGVVAVFLERLRRGLPLDVFGEGSQTRDFVYIDDAIRMLLAAMTVCQKPFGQSIPGGVLNVCRGQEVSLLTLAAMLGELLACTPLLRLRHSCPFDPLRQVGDPGQAAAILGVQPRIRLRTGLARTLKAGTAPFRPVFPVPVPALARTAPMTDSQPQAGYQPQAF